MQRRQVLPVQHQHKQSRKKTGEACHSPPTNALVAAIDVSALLQQQACALDGAVRCGMVQALVLGMGVRASFDNDVDACAFEGGGLRVRRS